MREPAPVNNTTRGIYCGGNTPSDLSNIMQYVTMATLGNATDFGDLSVARKKLLVYRQLLEDVLEEENHLLIQM